MKNIKEFLYYRIFCRAKWIYRDVILFIKSKYQLVRYGFEFRDTWSLDHSLSLWIIPRLKYLRDNCNGTPIKPDGGMTEDGPVAYTMEEWRAILDEIIWGFEFILKDDEYQRQCYPDDYDFGFETDESSYIVWNDDRKPDYTEYNKLKIRYEKSMLLFAANLRNLWD